MQNLEFFYGSAALAKHVAENPCLVAQWPQLWASLYGAGWRTFEKNGAIVCFCLSFSARYLSPAFQPAACRTAQEKLLRAQLDLGLEPGLHLFVSKSAVVQYIAR